MEIQNGDGLGWLRNVLSLVDNIQYIDRMISIRSNLLQL